MSGTRSAGSVLSEDDGSAGATALLEARGVNVSLDGVDILHEATLSVRRGEVHVLIGPNGAGKTTLANAITGHVPIAAGTVHLDGELLHGSVARRVHAGIGRKFQVPRVFPRLSPARNLRVARRSGGAQAEERSELLRRHEDRAIADELSHGERQRLELDMVLSQEPAVAVLDEPTAGMTRAERNELADAVRAVAGRQTFLIVEHDMDFVESVAETVSFMQNGSVIMSGSFGEVSADPRVREAYLGLEGAQREPRPGAQDAAGAGGGGASLSTEGLTVHHGPMAAVRDVSLELPAGGALGVLGRNGAGKTTLLSGLAGLLRTDGVVALDGEAVDRRPAWWRGRHGMALVPQGRQLFTALTVAENLALAECGPPGTGHEFDVHELFPALSRLMGRKAGLLSGGEQQQVAIARALLRRPTLLLLDEPTEGLAPVVVAEIAGAIERLAEGGLTIVLAEQHRTLVERLCTSFVVLRAGEVAGSGEIAPGVIDNYYEAL